jgi:EF hand
MPIMAALDKNSDGTLDAQEIAGASAALKTLDKNGDGKITPDELRPQRPDGGRGPGGPGGPGGQPGTPPPANK